MPFLAANVWTLFENELRTLSLSHHLSYSSCLCRVVRVATESLLKSIKTCTMLGQYLPLVPQYSSSITAVKKIWGHGLYDFFFLFRSFNDRSWLNIVTINHEFLITNVGDNALFKHYNQIHFKCLILKKSHGQQWYKHFRFDATDKAPNNWAGDYHEAAFRPFLACGSFCSLFLYSHKENSHWIVLNTFVNIEWLFWKPR